MWGSPISNAEAEAGIAEMNKVYHETGRDLYVQTEHREHD
jgi:hypothetical protein